MQNLKVIKPRKLGYLRQKRTQRFWMLSFAQVSVHCGEFDTPHMKGRK
jgi:hypothetical protein